MMMVSFSVLKVMNASLSNRQRYGTAPGTALGGPGERPAQSLTSPNPMPMSLSPPAIGTTFSSRRAGAAGAGGAGGTSAAAAVPTMSSRDASVAARQRVAARIIGGKVVTPTGIVKRD